MTRVAFLIGLLFLAGCSNPKGFTKPGATQAQFNTDRAQCEYEAKAAAAGYSGVIALKERELTVACMEARGYTLVYD